MENDYIVKVNCLSFKRAFKEALNYISSLLSIISSRQWEECYYAVQQGLQVYKQFPLILYIMYWLTQYNKKDYYIRRKVHVLWGI